MIWFQWKYYGWYVILIEEEKPDHQCLRLPLTHTHTHTRTPDNHFGPVTARHLTGSLIELRESCLLITRLKVSMYLYPLLLLIALKRQPDTVKWGDKQILGLLIEGDGKLWSTSRERERGERERRRKILTPILRGQNKMVVEKVREGVFILIWCGVISNFTAVDQKERALKVIIAVIFPVILNTVGEPVN